jgi:3-oxoacyl-[acyl-carrier-protein] synthase III
MRFDYGIGILGTGHALGSRVHTNEELCSTTLTSTTPEWIVEKTGIRRRYLVAGDESASSLSLTAARGALQAAGIAPEELGIIIVCTFSGDYLYPPVSAKLHRDLGAKGAQVFDIQANCAGFVTALTAASDRMFLDPEVRYALIVGTEILSPYVDWSDIETAIYFSDGAGAAVLGRVAAGRGIQASAFTTDTANYESVRLRGGGSRFPYALGCADKSGERSLGYMEMNGLATWKQAVTHLPTTVRRACEKAGVAPADVDHFIFHQANLHIIEYTMQKMRIPVQRSFTNVQEIGNTGAASIPIALSEAVRAGIIGAGQKVVMAGVGAGFNFGASVWVWDASTAGCDSTPAGRVP